VLPTVSVIIPTYNRQAFLRETLDSLAQQSYPSDCFEVIVVDDGSTDGTKEIEAETFPFRLRYFWQRNQGDAAARNLGAERSEADILLFLDDDILVEAEYLTYLVGEHEVHSNRIVVGTANVWSGETALSQIVFAPLARLHEQAIIELAFTDIYSNSMGLRRDAYFRIGMMQALDFPGSSMWCDVDFAYRAHRLGFEFRRCTKAKYWHRDYAVHNLERYTKRVRTAAYRAVVLFQKYPELPSHFSMFHGTRPITWGQDPPTVIARKLARYPVSARPTLWSMEQMAKVLEKHYPTSKLLPSLYRYIIGGHIYQGYREGLREFGQVKVNE
jgi:glycosyltransferase involved in cell wall biosynthesis